MDRTCKLCGKDISNTHPNRKFCCNKCKERDKYLRKEPYLDKEYLQKYRKAWYENKKKDEAWKEKINLQYKARYYKVQGFLRDYKVDKGCTDCGYNAHHAALEFDHIIGVKRINVCNADSIKAAQKEIEKCEVVCSNCHKIRTYNRLQNKK